MKVQKCNGEFLEQKKEFFQQQKEFFAQPKEYFQQKREFFQQQKEFFMQMDEVYTTNSIIHKHYKRFKKRIWGRVITITTVIFIFYGVQNRWLNYINTEYENMLISNSYSIEWISYTVQSGDTLWEIARRYMGSEHGYPIIAKENGLDNPHLIFPGEVLRIPIIDTTEE